ncbi:MAG: Spy/CpxP family protein refolding chaperone [Hyphomicrobium sp.]|jgi:hypothetical protein
MNPKTKYVLAGVAAVTVGLAAAGAVAHRAGGWDDHHDRGPGMHRQGGGPIGMMGMAGFGFGGPMARFCRHDGSEMADHMLVRIEHRVKPTEAQTAAFDEFKTATRAAADRMKAACPKQAAKDDAASDATPPSPIERLAEAQAGLEASLEALKTFRPAAEKFYATLDDAQKAKLTERHRGGGWFDRKEHNKGPGPDGGAKPDDGVKPETTPAPNRG